jgi:hypothetical protein
MTLSLSLDVSKRLREIVTANSAAAWAGTIVFSPRQQDGTPRSFGVWSRR